MDLDIMFMAFISSIWFIVGVLCGAMWSPHTQPKRKSRKAKQRKESN